MESMIPQLPALIGVMLGALCTYFSAAAAERARWRRSQTIRWDERKVASYVEYAHAIKLLIAAVLNLGGHKGMLPLRTRCSLAEVQASVLAAEDGRTLAFEAVLMYGTSEVVDAARSWHQSVFHLHAILDCNPDPAAWSSAIDRVSGARRDFYLAAKRNAGIPSGKSPESYEWHLFRWDKPVHPSG